MHHLGKLALAGLVTAGLSGCLNTDLERAGVGAALGGVTAAAVDGNVATGVLIGAAGGALCNDAGVCR